MEKREVPSGPDQLLWEKILSVAHESLERIKDFHFKGQKPSSPDLVEEYITRIENALGDELTADAKFLMVPSINREPSEIEEALDGFTRGVETAMTFEHQALSRREGDTIIKTGNELPSDDAKEFFLKGLFVANLGPKATDFPRLLRTQASTTSQQVLESFVTRLGIPNAEPKIFNWAQRVAQVARNFALESKEKAELIGWTSGTSPNNKGPLQQSLRLIYVTQPSL